MICFKHIIQNQFRYNVISALRKLTVIPVLLLAFVAGSQNPVANFTASPLQGCSPLIVNFTDLSTGNPSSWLWNFGNGNTSSLRNPTATYFTAGTYSVSLTVTNANGNNTMTKNQYIVVFENPIVDFSAATRTGCFPLTIPFSDLSTPGTGNTNISWQWDFGNGTVSTLTNPVATYNSTGTFSVTLKVSNDKGCSRTVTKLNYISVASGVNAGFTNTQSTTCSPPSTIFFANSSNGPGALSYQWFFGDGGTSTAVNPTYTYNTNGSYIVTLITTSSLGCVDSVYSSPILIGSTVTDFTSPSQVCLNQNVTFTNTSSPTPVSTRWNFGDGATATTLNGTHSYSAPGTYTVWLYNTYSNCQDSISHTIDVISTPAGDFTAPVRTKCQPNLQVDFQDLTPGSTTSWLWDFGDGGTSSLQNPSHTYTTYGIFTVRLTVTNTAGCPDTVLKTDYIEIRRAQISIPQLPAKGCIPHTIDFTPVINAVDAILTYNWDFGDGGTSTLLNPSHTYTVMGTYRVRLIITSSGGCTDSLVVDPGVRVGTKPVAAFTASPIPVCAGEPVQFTDNSAPADEWQWDFGDGGYSTVRNPTHEYLDTGYFSVQLIAFNNGCGDTLIRANYIYVLPPVARYNYTPDCSNRLSIAFRDSSILPLTWAWDFGDGGTSVAPNPVHVFPGFGAYNVRLIVTNGSCADTIIHTINVINENPDFAAGTLVACKPTDILFNPINITQSNIANYYWDFGDGGTLNISTPAASHVYLAAGTYTVTLITTDLNGCTDTIIKPNYIRVNGPTASFTSNSNACYGAQTVFNDLSVTDGVNAIVNWRWDFGDGTIQDFPAPPFQHIYNSVGIFTVKLVITDAYGCKDSLTLNDLITTSQPICFFTSNDLFTCPGSQVTVNNLSGPPGFANSWDFGDGTIYGTHSPGHSYADTGHYTIRLRITDPFGCEDSMTRVAYITVLRPVAGFLTSGTASSCTPFEVQFTNTSTYSNTILWDFSGSEGTSTMWDPVHFFSTPGIFNVKQVVTSPGGCKDSAFHSITVYDTAGSRVNYNPFSGCRPILVNFTSFTPGPVKNYFWDFGDGNAVMSSGPDTSHIYTSFGSFTPRLIMEDSTGCQIPVTGLMPVVPLGTQANFGADDSLFCDAASVQFTDSTTFNDPITGYSWTFGDGGSAGVQNPLHNYISPGLYTVRLAVRTQSNCVDTFTKNQYIRIVQRPLIDIGGDSVLCIHERLQNTGLFIQPDTSVVTWSWTFPNGNSSQIQNPPIQEYHTAGNFIITAIATNTTGCKDTTRLNIFIRPLPTASIPGRLTITVGTPVLLPAIYSNGTVQWSWSPPTGLSCADCPAPVVGPKLNTLYQVLFTDQFGCSNSASLDVIVLCKSINLFIPNTFSPNGDGSNDQFYVRGKGLERVKFLRIFNRWGEVVFEKKDFPVNDASAGWNGRYKGQRPAPGVYVYQAQVFCENGELITLNGNIALIL